MRRFIAAAFVLTLVVELAVRGALLHQIWGLPKTGKADPLIGNVPEANLFYCEPLQRWCITIGDYGTRSNGSPPPPAQRPLTLAVGDSFVFGDDVGDADSWPAILEKLIGARVVNAGVPAFGVDQTVLRGEKLAEVYSPDTIVVSFIPDDVLRSEMSYFSGRPKPYFDIEGGSLVLHPAPIPPWAVLDPLKWLLSRSLTANVLFDRFMHWEGPAMQTVHRRGREVACLLMGRLATLAHTRHARVVVLAQAQNPEISAEDIEIKDGVLECASVNGLEVLDIFPIIQSVPAEQRKQLFDGHMTAAGNQLVAAELAQFLERPTQGLR